MKSVIQYKQKGISDETEYFRLENRVFIYVTFFNLSGELDAIGPDRL